jgi:hypothetical protein
MRHRSQARRYSSKQVCVQNHKLASCSPVTAHLYCLQYTHCFKYATFRLVVSIAVPLPYPPAHQDMRGQHDTVHVPRPDTASAKRFYLSRVLRGLLPSLRHVELLPSALCSKSQTMLLHDSAAYAAASVLTSFMAAFHRQGRILVSAFSILQRKWAAFLHL